MTRLLPVLCAIALILSGCGSVPVRTAESETVLRAERLYADGDFRAAAQAFALAASEARGRGDVYRLREAESWREEGELGAARRAIEGLGPRRLDAAQRLRLTLLQGELALHEGDAADALSRLALSPESIPQAFRARFHYLRAQAHESLGNRVDAAREYARLERDLGRGERAENARRIEALLQALDDSELAATAAALPEGDALYRHAGRLLTARGLPLPRPYRREVAGMAEDARAPADADGYRPWNHIALLLPMQGPLALAGQAVRDGFLSAYFAEGRRRPEVRVYDSGETRESTLAALRAARDDGAEFIVGPIARDAVTALFEQDEISLPMLALNRSEVPPPPGSASFALAPEDEGIAAAERMLRRGWTRALAVVASDDGAQRSLAAFQTRFEQRGGRVLARIVLPDTGPDYTQLIREGLAQAGIQATAAVSGADIPAAVADRGVDGVFLAVRSNQARLFAPQLRVAGVFDVPMIATSQIATGTPNPRMDRELDGVEFTESPWLLQPPPSLPSRSALVDWLESARGGGARLFAFGIDAFQLAGQLDHLQTDPNARLAGATGELRVDGFGQVQRAPAWARYRGGHATPAPDGGLIGDGLQIRP